MQGRIMTRTVSKEAISGSQRRDPRPIRGGARSRRSNGSISPGRSNDQQSRTVIRTATPGGRIGHLRSLGAGHVDHHAARHAVLVSVVAVVLEPPTQHPDWSPAPSVRYFDPCSRHVSIVRSYPLAVSSRSPQRESVPANPPGTLCRASEDCRARLTSSCMTPATADHPCPPVFAKVRTTVTPAARGTSRRSLNRSASEAEENSRDRLLDICWPWRSAT